MSDPMLEDLLLAFSRGSGIYDVMYTPWGWPVVESLHFTGMCLLFGSVVLFDLRVLGLLRGIDVMSLHRLVPLGVAGYLLNTVTGLMFLTSVPDQYLYNPAFQLKVGAMIVAGLNLLWFYTSCYPRLGGGRLLVVRLSTGVSLLCWVMVVVCGRLITFYRPPWNWCFWCG